jgi:hypothetical protein
MASGAMVRLGWSFLLHSVWGGSRSEESLPRLEFTEGYGAILLLQAVCKRRRHREQLAFPAALSKAKQCLFRDWCPLGQEGGVS